MVLQSPKPSPISSRLIVKFRSLHQFDETLKKKEHLLEHLFKIELEQKWIEIEFTFLLSLHLLFERGQPDIFSYWSLQFQFGIFLAKMTNDKPLQNE